MGTIRRRLAASLTSLHGVFANPSLRRVQLAYAGSTAGNYAGTVALAVYAYGHGGATTVGLLSAFKQIVAAVIAPFAASFADRGRRERVMLVSDLGRVATTGGTAAAIATHAPSLGIYALATVTTVLGTVFRPAQASLTPLLARTPEELTAANVSASTFDSVGVFAGPSIAAFLLALGGTAAAFTFIAATFVWSASFVARIRTPEREPDEAEAPQRPDERVGFAGGFKAVAAEPRLRLLIGLYGAQCFVAGALTVFVVSTALSLLGLGSAGVGLLQAACGIGALAGAGITLTLVARARLANDLALGLALWGLPLVAIGLFPSIPTAAIALGVLGIGNTLVDISAMTLLQRTAPPEAAARVFGCLESVVVISLAGGAVLSPALIAAAGVRTALIVFGLVLPAIAVLRWRALSRIDEGARVPVERLAALRGVPFLAALPLQTIEELAARLVDVSVPAGGTLIVAGEEGDRFYLLHAGSLEIELPDGTRKVDEAPSYVGEIALLREIPRTATVRARTDAELWALERDDFLAAVTGHPRSRASADELVVARLGAAAA